MELFRQREMRENYLSLSKEIDLRAWRLYVFGHTDATGYLISMVKDSGCTIRGILDNNKAKQGKYMAGVPIMPPQELCRNSTDLTIVFVTSRACAAMMLQLKELGFSGRVVKLVDYDTFAEYDLSLDTITRRMEREKRGERLLERLRGESRCEFLVVCPFQAVGDVYYAMKYLRAFQRKEKIVSISVVVVGDSCAEVVKLFYDMPVFSLEQKEMDELVQAVLYTQAEKVLIVHHDRPYSNYLIRLLRKQLVHFSSFYKMGIYGLPKDADGKIPSFRRDCTWEEVPRGSSVVLMPYAKSVLNLPKERWGDIAKVLQAKGYTVFSNVRGMETPIIGTHVLRNVPLSNMQSLMEWAGGFIAIRSGLCDILQEAECRKIVLYPDACYSDTPWQVVQFFGLPGCDNVIFKNDGGWELYDRGRNRSFDFAKDLDF